MYSAQEVADILNAHNKDVTKRTVNYYAFEKKMFEVNSKRNCFTDEDIIKVDNILLLKEKTSYTLEQIKTIINTKTADEIKTMFIKENIVDRIFAEISPYINTQYIMSKELTKELNCMNLENNTKKIIGGFIKWN